MKARDVKLPLHIHGLWVICGASLGLAVASIIHAWRRPVSAISGIAPYSDILEVATGKLLRAPQGKYAAVALQPGDQVLRFNGLEWAHAQRLNLHELSDLPIGAAIELVVQRKAIQLPITLSLTAPDAWEQLALVRYGIAALLLWVTPTVLLITLTRALRRNARAEADGPLVDTTGVPLWFLTWQTAAIMQSMGGLKYPAAVLWVDALLPMLALCTGVISVPYPLAPRKLRPAWLGWPAALLALVYACAIVGQGLRSPFRTDDWRRGVQLLRPTDWLWQAALVPVLLGALIAIGGITATAFARQIASLLRRVALIAPQPLRHHASALAERFALIYGPVPTSIQIIAEFQLAILCMYTLSDLVPRIIGGVGGGYSVLLAGIPLSYLVLYSDTRAQALARYLIRTLIFGVAAIQIPNTVYRLMIGSYGMGANIGDIATLVTLAFGIVGGGAGIGIEQWWRQRALASDPLQTAIDGLFAQNTQEAFWNWLITQVGPHLGINTWLWLRTYQGKQASAHGTGWQMMQATPNARREWLNDASLSEALDRLPFDRPTSARVDTLALPSTLVLLPVYRSAEQQEVLIAVNPQWIKGPNTAESPLVLGRLMQAVQILRSREHDTQIVIQQRLLAEQRGALNEIYREITRMQRQRMFRENLRFSAILHDRAMQQVAIVVEQIRQMQVLTSDNQQQRSLGDLEQQCRAIDSELRRLAHELRPPGVGQQLRYTLEQSVMEWEQRHPAIHFDYRFEAHEGGLDEFQRDSIFMIVDQLVVNALKHAQPTTIQINVYEEGQYFVAEVQDNGRGFHYNPLEIRSDALGIRQRHDIASDLGGTLTIETRPGAGCRVLLHVPLFNPQYARS